MSTEVVKDSRTSLTWFLMHNGTAAELYLQIFNLATAPVTATTTIDVSRGDREIVIPAGAIVGVGKADMGAGEWVLSDGLAYAVSTTKGTYTAPTLASPSLIHLNLEYK